MSIPSQHHTSNVYLTGGDTKTDSHFGQYGRGATAGLSPSSNLCAPAAEIASVDSLLNRVAREPERGVPSVSDFVWAGDGI
jgi:hypothetical protein